MVNLVTCTIENNDDFYGIREKWNNLLQNSESDTVFLRWEWLYNWWLVYGKGSSKLWIVVVKEGDCLVGIAPMYVKRTLLGFNEVHFLGSNEVCSDSLDFIALKGYEDLVASLVLSFLQKEHRSWSVIHFSNISSKSKVLSAGGTIFSEKNCIALPEPSFCPYLSLEGSWNSIFDEFSPVIQNIIKRKLRILERNKKVSFIEATSYDEISQWWPQFVALNKMRLSMMNIVSPFSNSDFLCFHKLAINDLHEYQIPKLFFLIIDDKAIASLYVFAYNNKLFYYQSGLDANWQKFSPGTLLMYHAIRYAYERNMNEFDFLRGDEKYKSYWSKEKRIDVKARVYSNSREGWLSKQIDDSVGKARKFLEEAMNNSFNLWSSRAMSSGIYRKRAGLEKLDTGISDEAALQ